MTYKVDGIYSDSNGWWESCEIFCKQGEIRMIDGIPHYLQMTIGFTRYWEPLNFKSNAMIKEGSPAKDAGPLGGHGK